MERGGIAHHGHRPAARHPQRRRLRPRLLLRRVLLVLLLGCALLKAGAQPRGPRAHGGEEDHWARAAFEAAAGEAPCSGVRGEVRVGAGLW